MQVIMEMGKCTLGYADLARRAMGKKNAELMAKMRNEFKFGLREYDKVGVEEVYNKNNPLVLKDDGTPVILGACNNGFTEEEADNMWDVIQVFSRYAFNKSHAAAYALNAYQTAYLKYYYPAEFMANALTACGGEQEEIVKNIKECKRLGVQLLPPSVNSSDAGFTVEIGDHGRKAIRFGLGAIKNISTVDAIKEERVNGPFTSMRDFFARVSGRAINRTKGECLILAGAFDEFNPNRHELYNDYFGSIRGEKETSKKEYELMKKNKDKNVSKCFVRRDEAGFCDDDALAYEKELIGMYVSGHPLDKYPYEPWSSTYIGGQCEVYAVIKNIKVMQDKQGKAFAFFKAETLGDVRDCVMWSSDFAKYGDRLIENRTVCLRGQKAMNQRGEYQLKVHQVIIKMNTITSRKPKAAPIAPPPSSIYETADPMAELFAYA